MQISELAWLSISSHPGVAEFEVQAWSSQGLPCHDAPSVCREEHAVWTLEQAEQYVWSVQARGHRGAGLCLLFQQNPAWDQRRKEGDWGTAPGRRAIRKELLPPITQRRCHPEPPACFSMLYKTYSPLSCSGEHVLEVSGPGPSQPYSCWLPPGSFHLLCQSSRCHAKSSSFLQPLMCCIHQSKTQYFQCRLLAHQYFLNLKLSHAGWPEAPGGSKE